MPGEPLQNYKTWEEICDQVMLKLEKQLEKHGDHKRFKKWFMAREKCGWRFSYWVVWRMFEIWKELQKNLDHFIVNVGREGFGKTTLSMNQAAWIDPDFKLADEGGVIYDTKSYLNLMLKREEQVREAAKTGEKVDWKVIILDEGTELLSKDSNTNIVKHFEKIMIIQRVLKFCVIINIPDFFMLNRNIRLHRVRTLFQITNKGIGWFYSSQHDNRVMKVINGKGYRLNDIQSSWIPVKWKRMISFNLRFPDTVSYADYEALKIDGVRNTLISIQKDIEQSEKKKASTKAKKDV